MSGLYRSDRTPSRPTARTHDRGRVGRIGVLALLTLAAGACAGSYGPSSPVRVTAVRVTPQVVQLSAIGEMRQLTATIAPSYATDQAVAWESSDTSIVTVNATGLVTARRAGEGVFVTVTTHDGQKEASANLSVVPAP